MSDADYAQVADTGDVMQHTQTELTPAKTYWFKVVARNLVGIGQASNPISRIAATVPGAPVNLQMVQ